MARVPIISQIPPVGAAFLDRDGGLTQEWRRFLETLWKRTGGFQDSVSDAQPRDATLDAISGLLLAADKIIYGIGPDQAALADLTAYARTFLAAANAAGARAVLGLGALSTAGTINNSNWLGDDLAVINGGTGASNASDARANLGVIIGTNVQAFSANLATFAGIAPSANVQSLLAAADYAAIRTLLSLVIGTNVQAYSANLTTFAGIAPSANVQSILGAANYAAIRTLLGLGSLALLNTINGSNWSGVDLAVADGGTGASTATAARTNLDAARTAGAALTAATDTGYLFPPLNVQSGAYNLITPSDIGATVYHNSGSPHTWSLYPTGGAIPPNARLELRNDAGGGTITVAPQTGATLYWVASGLGAGTFKIPANCSAMLIHNGSDAFQLEGFGITT